MSDEVESQARRAGWVPLEDFKGDPSRWVPAEQYMDRANNEMPIMKGTLRTMNEKMARQEDLIRQQTDELSKLKGTLTDYVEFSKKAEERAYNKALADLKTQQRQAAATGDVDTFDKVSREIDDHIAQHPAMTGEPANVAAQPDKKPDGQGWIQPGIFEDWLDDNPWYEDEPQMTVYAQSMDRRLSRQEPGLSQKQRLTKITEMAKKKFPDYFGNGGKQQASEASGAGEAGETGRAAGEESWQGQVASVEGGAGTAAPARGKKGYASLPPEARAQCDEWAGRDGKGTGSLGSGFTREQYVKDYYGE